MKSLLLCILACSLTAKISYAPSHLSSFMPGVTPHPRKLVFSPYVNLDSDMSASSVGSESNGVQVDPQMNGPFGHAPVPAFGMGGMMPPSLGMTNMPMNYMYGNAMMHPLNPNANGMGGQMGGPMGGQMGGPMGNQQQPANNASGDVNDFNELGNDIHISDKFDSTTKLSLFDDPLNPADGVISQCYDIQQQAIEISNAIMKKQNRVIFKEIMKYLLRSKYLIATTEIKMVRVLRQKIYGLMKEYSSITEDQITAVAPAADDKTKGATDDLDKEIDEEYGSASKDMDFDDPSFDLDKSVSFDNM